MGHFVFRQGVPEADLDCCESVLNIGGQCFIRDDEFQLVQIRIGLDNLGISQIDLALIAFGFAVVYGLDWLGEVLISFVFEPEGNQLWLECGGVECELRKFPNTLDSISILEDWVSLSSDLIEES